MPGASSKRLMATMLQWKQLVGLTGMANLKKRFPWARWAHRMADLVSLSGSPDSLSCSAVAIAQSILSCTQSATRNAQDVHKDRVGERWHGMQWMKQISERRP